ncbi:MAG: hypothetical protein VYA34_14675 [Myxococcota bacterium]|nr:hypothetical protein [Myxococcota bacterium]
MLGNNSPEYFCFISTQIALFYFSLNQLKAEEARETLVMKVEPIFRPSPIAALDGMANRLDELFHSFGGSTGGQERKRGYAVFNPFADGSQHRELVVSMRAENGKSFSTEIPEFACGTYFIISVARWRIPWP